MKEILTATVFAITLLAASLPAQAQTRPSPDMMMRGMDKDGDGQISREEWRGPPFRFDQLAADGNGYITRVELESRVPVGLTNVAGPPLIDVHVHIHGHPSGTLKERLALNYAAAADQAIAHMDANHVRTSIIMVPPAIRDGLFDDQGLLGQATRYPGRFAVLGGGGTLNPVIHATPVDGVTDETRQKFAAVAERILSNGAIGFGEMAALHFSFFPQHPFEEVAPDHPLFLLLANIAARHEVPIDLHTELVPEEMAVPEKLTRASANNPTRVKANLANFERLLRYNPRARIILGHSIDSLASRKATILRRLFEGHPNLFMSLNMLPAFLFVDNMPLKGFGGIQPDWLQLIKDFPGRFMNGSDQFHVAPCSTCKTFNSLTPSRRWLALLLTEIARMIALANPQRIFKLGKER